MRLPHSFSDDVDPPLIAALLTHQWIEKNILRPLYHGDLSDLTDEEEAEELERKIAMRSPVQSTVNPSAAQRRRLQAAEEQGRQ